MTFTESQKEAVFIRNSSVLVSAGAGSGKTRVLTERLMEYIDPQMDNAEPLDIDRFLIITFTRAAAGELRARIGAAIAERLQKSPNNRHLRRQLVLCKRAQIGTIDSFCANLLREYSAKAEISPAFRVLEEEQSERLRSAALDRVLERQFEKGSEEFLRLVDSVGAGRDDSRLAELVLKLHSAIQSHARPEQWVTSQLELLEKKNTRLTETEWGKDYLSEVSRKLSFWESQFRECLKEMKSCEPIQKAYGDSFQKTFEALHNSCEKLTESWDAAAACFPIPFPRVTPLRNNPDPQFAEDLKAKRSLCKKQMDRLAQSFFFSEEEILQHSRETAPEMRALLELTLTLEKEFQTAKRRADAMDFSDLEHRALSLLLDGDGKQTVLAETVSARFKEIMIDEYQDVSRIQDSIFYALSRKGENLFFVGDVKQAIYRFRLADPTIFTEKAKEYSITGKGKGRLIHLQENFRSRPEILDAVNEVFSTCMSEDLGDLEYGEDEFLKYGRTDETKEFPVKPELVLINRTEAETDGTEQEATFVAREIQSLIHSAAIMEDGEVRPVRYGDIAILLRSANTVGNVFRRVLVSNGIPVISSAGGDFFHSPEISVMSSVFQIIDNPHRDIPLITVLQSPSFGFSSDRLGQIRTAEPSSDFYTALCAAQGDDVRDFLKRFDRLRSDAMELNPQSLSERIIEELNLFALCSAQPDGEQRVQRLLDFSSMAEEFTDSGQRGNHRFMRWLLNREKKKIEPVSAMSGGDAVRILSIHKSKGLEFPVVFYACLAARFNLSDTSARVLVHPRLGLGPKITEKKRKYEYPSTARIAISSRLHREMLSEELRLVYVAMTRARERLILTASVNGIDEKKEAALRLSKYEKIPSVYLENVTSPLLWLLPCALKERSFRCITAESVMEDSADSQSTEELQMIPEPELMDELNRNLNYQYPHSFAVNLPSKITATERKSWEEINPDGVQMLQKKPGSHFAVLMEEQSAISAKRRGTATHLVLQQIDFSKTAEISQIRDEISRLVKLEYLTKEEGDSVKESYIHRFFTSTLGQRLLHAEKVYREFRFSLLKDAGELLGEEAAGEEILLQGIVDLCFEEDGALVLVDYKTDILENSEQLQARAEHYRLQLNTYASALQRIFRMPIKEKTLYFLSVGKSVTLES